MELAAAVKKTNCSHKDKGSRTIRYSASLPLALLQGTSPIEMRLGDLAKTHRLRGKTIEYLQAARDQRSKLQTLLQELDKLKQSDPTSEKIPAKIKEIEDVQKGIGDKPSLARLPKEIGVLEREILKVKIARELHSGVEQQIVAAKDAAGLSLLTRLLQAEKVRVWVGKAGNHVLQVKIVAAGGSVKTASNFFRTKIEHSGGAVVSFLLYDNQGVIKDSGTLRHRADYRSFKDSKWSEGP